MKNIRYIGICALAVFLSPFALKAQIAPGVYLGADPDTTYIMHEVKIDGNYFIHTKYSFISSLVSSFNSTIGGFYTSDPNSIRVRLEFNSNYPKDSLHTASYIYKKYGDALILSAKKELVLMPVEKKEQDLDGTWLFATRGPDTGQERRGDENPRKTLKFLMDGHFQWVAYNTETMQFSGSGGGRYTASDGKYTEIIQYFSRDNSRVGAVLEFNYELIRDDWHHTGLNSRGEPMYEIWSRRK